MSELKEIKIGKLHYTLSPSGNWVSSALNGESSILTTEDLVNVLVEYKTSIQNLRTKFDMLETLAVHYIEQLTNG